MALDNYAAMQTPVNVAQSFGQGFNVGNAIEQARLLRQQQQLETQAAQAKLARAQQMQTDFAKIAANPTVEGITKLSLLYPEVSEKLTGAFNQLDKKAQQGKLDAYIPAYSAILSGKSDIATNLLQEHADALRNSGDEKAAKGMEDFSTAIKNNPDQAKMIGGLYLSGAMGPDKFSGTFSQLSQEQRATDKSPYEMQKAIADANTAEITASNAQEKQQAEIGKLNADAELARNKPAIDAAKKAAKEDPFGIQSSLDSGTHGEDFLKTLPSGLASQVKALSEGRMAFPSGMGLKSEKVQQLLQAVGQYDPNFDAVNYGSRYKTRASFTAGVDANNITAINTALGHLNKLDEAFKKLDNGDYPTLNSVGNWIGYNTGNKEIQKNLASVDTAAKGVAGEMAKVFRATGMSVHEIDDWKNSFQPNSPPAKIKEVMATAMDMLHSRLDALAEKYNQGMGTTKNGIELLTPQNQKIINSLEGIVDKKQNAQPNLVASPAIAAKAKQLGWTDAQLQQFLKDHQK